MCMCGSGCEFVHCAEHRWPRAELKNSLKVAHQWHFTRKWNPFCPADSIRAHPAHNPDGSPYDVHFSGECTNTHTHTRTLGIFHYGIFRISRAGVIISGSCQRDTLARAAARCTYIFMWNGQHNNDSTSGVPRGARVLLNKHARKVCGGRTHTHTNAPVCGFVVWIVYGYYILKYMNTARAILFGSVLFLSHHRNHTPQKSYRPLSRKNKYSRYSIEVNVYDLHIL